MALDLDVDDGPSFHELVQSGRNDVLKGRSMAQCWADLADQHPFFKDIAKEGRLRGTTLGTVLAAVEGISRVVRRTDALSASQAAAPLTAAIASPSGPSPLTTPEASLPKSSNTGDATADVADGEVHNAETLVRVADAYVRLYSSTPVPTRVQWLESLRTATSSVSTSAGVANTTTDNNSSSSNPVTSSAASSATGRYVSKLQATLDSVALELASNDDAEGEDGGFAEEELKECVRCCMAAGRRAARHASLSKAEGRAVREMVKALQDYVGSSTLEW